MESKTIYCKNCGAQMDNTMKNCPQCGSKNPHVKRPIYKKWWFWVIIVVVVLGIIGAGNSGPKKVGENKPADTGETSQSNTSSSTSTDESTFYVGDKVELNGVVVSLDSVTESNGSTYNKPGDGNVFVLCTFTIENNSSSEINVSSLLCFDAYCDSFACNYSLSAQLESADNQLDGTVAAGKKMKGVIGYEVAADWSELEIHFTPDFWSHQNIVFIANH